jgi:hypothetical protein
MLIAVLPPNGGRVIRRYLFLYVSPRVVNRDVTEKLAGRDGAPFWIPAVTTNAKIISAAAERYLKSG